MSQAPSTPFGALRLTELRVGTTARLHDAQVDRDSRALLRGLGLTDDSVLRVCKQGEPCVIQVRATRIGMSHRVARHILVVPDEQVGSADALRP